MPILGSSITSTLPPAVPLVKGGQLRALAVTGAKRLAELPDVPSMAEAGLPEVNIGLWSGLFAPAATPPAITQKLETELRRAILSPEVGDRLRALAVEPSGIPSEGLRRLIEAGIKLTAEVVKAANRHSRSDVRRAQWRRRPVLWRKARRKSVAPWRPGPNVGACPSPTRTTKPSLT
jgi:hypothetical protein